MIGDWSLCLLQRRLCFRMFVIRTYCVRTKRFWTKLKKLRAYDFVFQKKYHNLVVKVFMKVETRIEHFFKAFKNQRI